MQTLTEVMHSHPLSPRGNLSNTSKRTSGDKQADVRIAGWRREGTVMGNLDALPPVTRHRRQYLLHTGNPYMSKIPFADNGMTPLTRSQRYCQLKLCSWQPRRKSDVVICARDLAGMEVLSYVIDIVVSVPASAAMHQDCPSPFPSPSFRLCHCRDETPFQLHILL